MTFPTLRQVLALDAASCALFFALGIGATASAAEVTGLSPAIVAAAGWICLPAAVLLAVAASSPARALVGLLAAMNAGWVVASIAVWVNKFGSLTALGHAVVIAQAIAVQLFILLEWRGMKTLRAEPAALA